MLLLWGNSWPIKTPPFSRARREPIEEDEIILLLWWWYINGSAAWSE
jgi:hypothetical protein